MQENRSSGKAKAKTATDKENSRRSRQNPAATKRRNSGTYSPLLKQGHTTTANGTTFVGAPEGYEGYWADNVSWGDNGSGGGRYSDNLVKGAVGDERIKQAGIDLNDINRKLSPQQLSQLRGWQPETQGADPQVIALLKLLGIHGGY